VLYLNLSGALEDAVRCGDRALPSLASYESNVLYALRFMVDTNMGGGQWLEIPAGMKRCCCCCATMMWFCFVKTGCCFATYLQCVWLSVLCLIVVCDASHGHVLPA
jgi:hypothetical protein